MTRHGLTDTARTTTDTTDCSSRVLCVKCATSTDGECWRRSWWCSGAANLLLNTRTPAKERVGVKRRRRCACLCDHHASHRRRHSRRRLSLPPANSGITKSASPSPTSHVGICWIYFSDADCCHLECCRCRYLPPHLACVYTIMPATHEREAAASYCMDQHQQPVRRSFWRTLPTTSI